MFTPPHGSALSVWVTSLVTSREMIDMVLEKYRVEDRGDNFALYIVWDSGGRGEDRGRTSVRLGR